jgi:hypothetical protein
LSEFIHHDYSVFVVDISYPIADAILTVPAVVILVTLRSDYEHSIPWSLFSMSLLVNAVADCGFINYVMNNNVESTWIWDLFFVADFLLKAAALYWYNHHYISKELANWKSTTLRRFVVSALLNYFSHAE